MGQQQQQQDHLVVSTKSGDTEVVEVVLLQRFEGRSGWVALLTRILNLGFLFLGLVLLMISFYFPCSFPVPYLQFG